MEQKQCKHCQYYLQHLVLKERKLFRIHCGHCTLGKTKQRKPNTKACEAYIPGLPPEEAFVSKEYLSKELLQYMMNLELLPQIEERG